jgi:hypothetical protein
MKTRTNKQTNLTGMGAILFLLAVTVSCLGQTFNGLKNAEVLIIRHAEKLESGQDLSPAGFQRADAYVRYFGEFKVEGKPLKLDSLFAAADSKNSHRPRLTLEPLSRALHLPIVTNYNNKAPAMLADELKSKPHGHEILVCWHHGKIPELMRDLGADPSALLPDGKWPDDEFGWVIELRYDGDGKLMADQCRRIDEHILLRTE